MKLFLFILMWTPTFLMAQEFKTAKAKEALESYIAEMQRLETLKEKADAKYEKDLVDAREAAMKAGNLKEAVLINSELEKLNSLEAKSIDPKLVDKDNPEGSKGADSKSKNQKGNVLVDDHKGRTAAGVEENNTYKFEVAKPGKTSTLKIYSLRENQRSNGEVFMIDPSQKIVNVGKIVPFTEKDRSFKMDVSKHVTAKGNYSFTIKYTDGNSEILIEKVELIIE